MVARFLGQKLSDICGQSIIIDNRAGAGGNVGAEAGSLSGDAFGAFLRAETEKWGKVVKDSGTVMQ